ncbi:MAG: hypothetical protein ACQEQE_11220, partial [Bacillota bacterium]
MSEINCPICNSDDLSIYVDNREVGEEEWYCNNCENYFIISVNRKVKKFEGETKQYKEFKKTLSQLTETAKKLLDIWEHTGKFKQEELKEIRSNYPKTLSNFFELVN